MTITAEHEEKETLAVDVIIEEHAERGAPTALFKRTRLEFMAKHGGKCWICGATEADKGEANQLHHRFIERCFSEEDIDWAKVKEDVPDFDWEHFDPKDPYSFVDNCNFNGLILCREHHTERGSGTHMMPNSLWVMQRYLKDKTRFSPTETIIRYLT